MGRKHKHSKDKLHKTVTELASHHNATANRDLELSVLHRRLKFDSCCLSLNSVTKKPMGLCDQEGFCYVFECDLIVKFLEKFNQIHPITGQKVTAKDLFDLRFHKNDEDQYHCPVIYKLFNQHSKIVANRKSGHVYSHEAYYQLNAKPNNLKDLLTDEPFSKEDIVTIQDPEKADAKWNVSEFHYVKNKLRLDDDAGESKIRDIEQSRILKSTLEEYKSKAGQIAETFNKIVGGQQQQTTDVSTQERLDKVNSAVYSDGALSSSVTSTVAAVAQTQQAAMLNEEQILYPKIKKKGYVQLLTNFGPINLELYCDRTPKACHNFLKLISKGYYDDTIFHRLVKNFILQGGDPTGTGSGGQSAWGEPFRDECHGDLKHEGRGVLAMANSGPNTNKSQFYITLRGVWDHLDGKHTVFGRVVGGLDTLERIESEVETDKKDRPKNKEVKLVRATKYCDPFEEALQAIAEERQRVADEEKLRASKRSHSDSSSGQASSKKLRSGVGAYINLERLHDRSTAQRTTATKSVVGASMSANTRASKQAAPGQKSKQAETQEQLEETNEPDDNLSVNSFVAMGGGGLSSQLAAIGNKCRENNRSTYGNFSNW